MPLNLNPNTSDKPREVMTIIYMDQDIRVIQPRHEYHENDLKGWMPGMKVGEVPTTPLNPVLYSDGEQAD